MCNAIRPYVQCNCTHCRFGVLRGIASGCIWPLGREHACDLAQIRQSERDRDAQAAAA